MDIKEKSEELKRKFMENWSLSLYKTHKRDLLNLGVFFKVPSISIDIIESDLNWGFWKPDTRIIGINSKLILDYPWDAALGILGHETAHQLVSDLRPEAAKTEPPHGPAFQSMCEQLKLQPLYRTANCDLNDGLSSHSLIGPHFDKIEDNPLVVKIKKLLALSGSPEPREAEAALTKASELMEKHNIDTAAFLAGAEDFEIWRLPWQAKRLDRKTSLIASILQDHFFVRTIIVTRYSPLHDEYLKSIDIIGRKPNLSMAEHVYHYLNERAETLWEKHKPLAARRGEKGLGAKTAFIMGLLLGLDDKLTEAERNRVKPAAPGPANPVGQNLLPADYILADKKLGSFVEQNYPSLRKGGTYAATVAAPFSSSAGREAGESLNIYDPIASANRGKGGVSGYLGKG